MPYSSEQYLEQAKALLPRGRLWESLTEPGTQFEALLQALVDELARVDARTAGLLDETDPRTVNELLVNWESFVGLPDECTGQPPSLAQRREMLLQKLTSTGDQSRAYFIRLADTLGFPDAAITEYDPHTVDMSVDAPIYGADWQFAWQLSAPTPAIDQFNADSTVDESLGEQSPTTRLECVINKRKPAHTLALYEYT
ncbi:YmfQ family protein [Thiohalophilus sp.]|uniref:YmfQ family protein n=1 Tax=Thiohalophilus sp. TaxID=3028392 RepID=UPI002ACDC19F|nr:putative phage tail protein [Thiohalophilus sp.]MDZ7804347.1 putative phage tail protein [Thiohalophilus sp.]